MSLEKAIQHKKERRKPYRKAARWAKGCRNHGSCGYCLSNRTHKHAKQLAAYVLEIP